MDKKQIRGKVFQNFNRKNRWRGIIDYKSLVFLVVYVFGLWNLTKLFDISLITQIYILIIFTIPVVVFVFAYIDEESVVDVLFNILKFYLRRKWYVYVLKENVNVVVKYSLKQDNKCIEHTYKV